MKILSFIFIVLLVASASFADVFDKFVDKRDKLEQLSNLPEDVSKQYGISSGQVRGVENGNTITLDRGQNVAIDTGAMESGKEVKLPDASTTATVGKIIVTGPAVIRSYSFESSGGSLVVDKKTVRGNFVYSNDLITVDGSSMKISEIPFLSIGVSTDKKSIQFGDGKNVAYRLKNPPKGEIRLSKEGESEIIKAGSATIVNENGKGVGDTIEFTNDAVIVNTVGIGSPDHVSGAQQLRYKKTGNEYQFTLGDTTKPVRLFKVSMPYTAAMIEQNAKRVAVSYRDTAQNHPMWQVSGIFSLKDADSIEYESKGGKGGKLTLVYDEPKMVNVGADVIAKIPPRALPTYDDGSGKILQFDPLEISNSVLTFDHNILDTIIPHKDGTIKSKVHAFVNKGDEFKIKVVANSAGYVSKSGEVYPVYLEPRNIIVKKELLEKQELYKPGTNEKMQDFDIYVGNSRYTLRESTVNKNDPKRMTLYLTHLSGNPLTENEKIDKEQVVASVGGEAKATATVWDQYLTSRGELSEAKVEITPELIRQSIIEFDKAYRGKKNSIDATSRKIIAQQFYAISWAMGELHNDPRYTTDHDFKRQVDDLYTSAITHNGKKFGYQDIELSLSLDGLISEDDEPLKKSHAERTVIQTRRTQTRGVQLASISSPASESTPGGSMSFPEVPYNQWGELVNDALKKEGLRVNYLPAGEKNFDKSQTKKDTIAFHAGTGSKQSDLYQLRYGVSREKKRTSANFYVDKNGEITMIVPPDQVSFGVLGGNANVLNIETESKYINDDYEEWTEKQKQSIQRLVQVLQGSNPDLSYITSHGGFKTTPGVKTHGKTDPGSKNIAWLKKEFPISFLDDPDDVARVAENREGGSPPQTIGGTVYSPELESTSPGAPSITGPLPTAPTLPDGFKLPDSLESQFPWRAQKVSLDSSDDQMKAIAERPSAMQPQVVKTLPSDVDLYELPLGRQTAYYTPVFSERDRNNPDHEASLDALKDAVAGKKKGNSDERQGGEGSGHYQDSNGNWWLVRYTNVDEPNEWELLTAKNYRGYVAAEGQPDASTVAVPKPIFNKENPVTLYFSTNQGYVVKKGRDVGKDINIDGNGYQIDHFVPIVGKKAYMEYVKALAKKKFGNTVIIALPKGSNPPPKAKKMS